MKNNHLKMIGHESSIHPHLTSWSMDLQVEHMGIMGLCSAAPVADAETGSYPAVSGLPSGCDLDRRISQMNRGTNMNREKQGIPWGDHHLREPWVVNGITDQKWRSKRVFLEEPRIRIRGQL